MTGNATNYKNSQGDNPICSTRDEISQPSRPISPRAATAYHGCKNFTYTSKTRHVKRTQMVVTVRFTIRVFLTFSYWYESNTTKLSCEEMWSLKTRTVARKFWIGGLNLHKGTWHSENLIKSLLIYSVSYLSLEGLSSPMPTVAAGLVQISLMLSLLKYVQK